MTATEAPPLAGYKVLDLGRGLAGPFAATLLADFGADVVKVEQPGVGDFMRHWGPANGVWWQSIARGKRSVALDLRHERAKDVMQGLVEWADVLVESFRPRVLERLGLGADQLHEWNPDLVVLRVSGYGQTGPNRDLPGFGKVAEAFGGFAYLTGAPEGPPMHTGFALADMTSGLMGAFGVLAALLADHGDEGRGQVIDLALYETILRLMDYPIPVYSSTGKVPGRVGNHQPFGAALSNVFPAADGRFVTYSAGTDAGARRVLALVGGAAYAQEPRFASLREMCDHEQEIDARIGAWMGERTAEEVVREFAAIDAVAAIVHTSADIVADPHIAARDDLIELPGVDATFVAPMPKLSKTPGRVRHPGPAEIGQDGRAILAEILELDDDQIQDLIDASAVALPANGGHDAG